MGEAVDAFLDRHAALLTVPRGELRRRGVVQAAAELWVVTYEHAPGGVPVAGSRLTLVVGHGNLLLWGSEGIFPDAGGAAVAPGIDAAAARAAVAAYVGWDDKRDAWIGAPSEALIVEAAGSGALATDLPGRRHRRIWRLAFRRAGVAGTWVAWVDAGDGEVVQFGDANRYGWARGGIYPDTWSDFERSRPLGLLDLDGAGLGGETTIEGLFVGAAAPGAASASLAGHLVDIQDRCVVSGPPAVVSDDFGDLNFDGGPPNPTGDANCTTNGVGVNGGVHNTHAARTAYVQITRVKARDRGWLPGLAWLDQAHEVRVNQDAICNAYWSPYGGFNAFFRAGTTSSGVHCANTGEIAAVLLHESGHGLDQNDAQGAADEGTGEAYADVHALLALHDSCLGPGFLDRHCGGYGLPCTVCTGVRDVDYARHRHPGGPPVDEPFTPANFTAVHCQGGFGAGPCGREPHCESYPGTGALWDLAVRELAPAGDAATAWKIVERDWMLGTEISTSMFNCVPGTFASDGCAATSWFEAMLAADDDDGDLADGTPHAAAIYAAFAAHAIACGEASDPGNQSTSACAPLAAPALTASAAGAAIDLSWSPVAGARAYAVWKNEGECDKGALLAAVVGGGAGGWTDSDVADHQPYAYRVQALGDGDDPAASACASPLSECALATTGACPAPTSPPVLSLPAANRVDVSWDAPPACGGYAVYRRRGGCAAGGALSRLATALAGPPYDDDTVSGGVLYAYQVAALDPTGAFEVGLSPCAEIVATGLCNEPPQFTPGLTVESAEALRCGLDLSWQPATAVCGGQPVVYNVYRAGSQPFLPSDANRVATGLTAPAYHDSGLAPDAGYVYLVRAEALSGIGPGPGGGREDGNLDEASGRPSGPVERLFADDLEGGGGAWSEGPGPNDGEATLPWTLTESDSHSPATSWFVAGEPHVKDRVLAITAPLVIPAGGASFLRFWHRFDTELGYDGGVLEYSLDGGDHWLDVLDGVRLDPPPEAGNSAAAAPPPVPADDDRIVEGGYTEVLSSCCSNPLPHRAAWSGSSGGFQRVVVDLGAFAGDSVRFRWRFGTDHSVAGTGWWIDDVEVITAGPACYPDPLFADGFESGTLARWSRSEP